MGVNEIISNNTFTETVDHAVVTIGNENIPTEFQAHVKMRFWNEDDIWLELPNTKGVPTLKDDKITLDLTTGKYEWYNGREGLKWLFCLKSKPLTNKYSLNIGGNWQDFNFNYQTPFANPTPFYGDAGTDTNGDEWIQDVDGGFRPRKVDGSYAVKHKIKKNHILGQTNYGTGKVLHIYVPKATDADGKSVWCTLHIENGIYTVTIPQSFLDTAVYPVTVNDEFGWPSGSSAGTIWSCEDVIIGSLYTGAAGTATSITCWINKAGPPNPNYTCNIYKHSDLSELTNGISVEGTTPSDARKEFAFVSNPTVEAIDYILVINGDAQYARGRYDVGAANNGHHDGHTYGTWPDPLVPTHTNRDMEIYVTYTPGGTVYQELLLGVSAAGTVSGSDAGQMVDTGLGVSAAGTVSCSEIKVVFETGLGVSAAGTVGESDVQQMVDAGREVSGAGTVGESDVQQMVETGKEVTAAATAEKVDAHQMVETSLGVSAAGSVLGTDVPVFIETGLGVSADGTVGESDVHVMVETDLTVLAAAAPLVYDIHAMSEAALGVSADGVVSCTDVQPGAALAHIAAFMILRKCTS